MIIIITIIMTFFLDLNYYYCRKKFVKTFFGIGNGVWNGCFRFGRNWRLGCWGIVVFLDGFGFAVILIGRLWIVGSRWFAFFLGSRNCFFVLFFCVWILTEITYFAVFLSFFSRDFPFCIDLVVFHVVTVD